MFISKGSVFAVGRLFSAVRVKSPNPYVRPLGYRKHVKPDTKIASKHF